MATARGCPQCGGELDPHASPGGLCPRCLLKLGLGSTEPASVPSVLDAGLEHPERIGPYRIVKLLGEGGMGLVYLAEQEEPIRRQVAVKLIKLGMDTREVIARFETERQVLALMSHPHIAKVFEAGATEQGRPYFVMEYTEGVPITEYCDRHRLSVRRRLDLFIQVCGAIQHAHQKGIIHRDVKPSNLLVEMHEGEPVPKVIDFGIAKATQQKLAEKTVFTRYGRWIGTPAYMSPEQAEMSELEVDSRADIYALGVLLYEILAGTLPFDPETLRRHSDEEVRRILRTEEPPSPSARVTGEAARARRTERAALAKRLRGDLDWITMKAMDKDRARRYASASELASDVRRHLDHEAVVAGPPGVLYRLGKLVRRRRLAVTAAAAVFLTLVAGITGTALALVRARSAERLASQEAATAREVSRFLIGLFEVSDPGESRGNTVTAREILDEGAEKVRQRLDAEPLVEARLLGVMGSVYRKLGLYGQATPLLEEAIEIRETLPESDDVEMAIALKELGILATERGDYGRAESLLQKALAILRRSVGSEHAEVAATLKELGVLDYRKGDLDAAEPLYRQSMEIALRVLGPEDPLVAWNLNDLANIYTDRGDYDRAEPLFRRSLEIHEKVLGLDHHYVANNLNNLANIYHYRGAFERALPLRERALAIHEKVLGPQHPLVALSLSNLGLIYKELGAYDEAEARYRRALEIREQVLGRGHVDVAMSLYQLASLDRDRGLYERAEPLFRKALKVGEAAVGAGDFRVAVIRGGLADLYRAMGDYDRAEPLYQHAIETLEQVLGRDHARTAAALNGLAELDAARNRYDDAEALFVRSLAIRQALHARDPDSPLGRADLASTLVGLGNLYRLRREEGKAEEAWTRAVATLESVTPGSEVVRFLHPHAMALLYLDRVKEASPLVDKLMRKGWSDPAFLELCRRRGISSRTGNDRHQTEDGR